MILPESRYGKIGARRKENGKMTENMTKFCKTEKRKKEARKGGTERKCIKRQKGEDIRATKKLGR